MLGGIYFSINTLPFAFFPLKTCLQKLFMVRAAVSIYWCPTVIQITLQDLMVNNVNMSPVLDLYQLAPCQFLQCSYRRYHFVPESNLCGNK